MTTLLDTIQSESQATGISPPVPSSATSMTIEMLQLLSAATGVATDANVGSNVRSLATTIAAIIEQQSITSKVLTAQNILNLLLTIYNITVPQATYATGSATFSLPASLTTTTLVPQGTQISTSGGLVFQTTQNLTIPAGSLSGSVSIQSIETGTIYNVSAGAITNILSSLPQTVTVTNPAPTSGGTNSPSVSTVVNAVANAVLGTATSTPQSIASYVYGTSISSGETVQYSTVYEPWVYSSGSGNVAGYTVYIDNGSGAASSDLISAVNALLLNSNTTGIPSKIPAGVPFSVEAVVPVEIDVTVTATTEPEYNQSIPYISTLVTNATDQYFQQLNFGDTYLSSDLLVNVTNNILGMVQGISVTATPSDTVTTLPYERAILNQLTINITAAT